MAKAEAKKALEEYVITFQGADGLVGVGIRDLEAVSFAFGFLMSQEAHVHAGDLHTLKNRIRMALEGSKRVGSSE